MGEGKMSMMQRLWSIGRRGPAAPGGSAGHVEWVEAEPGAMDAPKNKAAKPEPSAVQAPPDARSDAAGDAATPGSDVPTSPEAAPEARPQNAFAFEFLDELIADTAVTADTTDARDAAPSMWSLAVDSGEPREEEISALAGAEAPLGRETAPRARRSGRVKTRLLGFETSDGMNDPIFVGQKLNTPSTARDRFPVGWIVVVRGPGRGESIALKPGVSQIGRDEDQAIQLDFGDTSVSRANHAAIAFDEEDRKFFIGHGGKSNLVRLNGRPLLSTEQAKNGDLIRIGETTLRLVTLCGEDFTWAGEETGSDAAKD